MSHSIHNASISPHNGAVFDGLARAVRDMKDLMLAARR